MTDSQLIGAAIIAFGLMGAFALFLHQRAKHRRAATAADRNRAIAQSHQPLGRARRTTYGESKNSSALAAADLGSDLRRCLGNHPGAPLKPQMKPSTLTALLLMTLVACESDAAKYERLKLALWEAQTTVEGEEGRRAKGEAVCPELANLPTDQYLSRCSKIVSDHQTDLALRLREYNRFMNR